MRIGRPVQELMLRARDFYGGMPQIVYPGP